VRQLETGRPDLRFTPLLEKEFREFCLSQVISRGRLAAAVAFVLALAVTSIAIIWSRPSVEHFPRLVAFAVLNPMLGMIVLATLVPALMRFYETIAAVAISLAGLTGIYIVQIASLNGTSYVLASLVLLILYVCRFLGLQFKLGVGIAGALIGVHGAMGYALELSSAEILYMTAILTSATIIGGVSSYNWEKTLRLTFIEQRMLNELAQRDGLTGLYNRRIFDDYIQRIWRQARRDEVPVEIILIDIDHFKIYNDLYGHQAGDDCLRRVAQVISRAAKRPFDFGAR
jgi:predicted signal transduction protein with EAL and GGDEF domain